MMIFEAAGISSLQDLGRPGFQNQGIGDSGAMDRFALRVANSLLGNVENSGAIEIALGGVRIRTQMAQWFALTGADLSATINGVAFPMCQPVWVPVDSLIEIRKPIVGCRAYLAVQGGYVAEPVLGSVATDARSGFGGFNGTWIKKNDRVAFNHLVQAIGRPINWHTHYANPAFAKLQPLRLIVGPLWQQLDVRQRQNFVSHDWHISPDSDRMGIRLTESLPVHQPFESILSSAVAFGSIQLPPDHRPIILAAYRQTTGGYPLIGTLASISHSALAQLKPGDAVRFEPIELADAQSEWRQRELLFSQWQTHIKNWWLSAHA